MKKCGNIIIFSDFAVFSSYSKSSTLGWLRKSASFLTNYHDPFPTCDCERILISICEMPISLLSIDSSCLLDDTIDILERIIDLLDSDEVDFFCPNE